MNVFSIDRTEARLLYQFCFENKSQEFFIVKDRGAYMRGIAIDENQKIKDSIVFYVQGCDYKKDEYWFDEACDQFGGDDFSHRLPTYMLESFLTNPRYESRKFFQIGILQDEIFLLE